MKKFFEQGGGAESAPLRPGEKGPGGLFHRALVLVALFFPSADFINDGRQIDERKQEQADSDDGEALFKGEVVATVDDVGHGVSPFFPVSSSLTVIRVYHTGMCMSRVFAKNFKRFFRYDDLTTLRFYAIIKSLWRRC